MDNIRFNIINQQKVSIDANLWIIYKLLKKSTNRGQFVNYKNQYNKSVKSINIGQFVDYIQINIINQ